MGIFDGAVDDAKRAKDKAREENARTLAAQQSAADQQGQWMDELAPEFARAARKIKLPYMRRDARKNPPFRFSRYWQINIGTGWEDRYGTYHSETFAVTGLGVWTFIKDSQTTTRRVPADSVNASYTRDDFVRAFEKALHQS